MQRKIFRGLFIGSVLTSLAIFVNAGGHNPLWELPADIFFTAVVFSAIFLSIKNGSTREDKNRMFAVGWLVVFALFQTLHLVHHNRNDDYFLTTKMVDIAYLMMLLSVWIHHSQISRKEVSGLSRLRGQVGLDIFNLLLLLGMFPFVFGMGNTGHLMSDSRMGYALSMLLLYDLLLSVGLVIFLLNHRFSMVHGGVVILLMISNVLQSGTQMNPLNGLISSLCLWLSYWLFFELYLAKESRLKDFYAISERDQIFSVFNDNKDAFLVLEKDAEDSYRVVNLNRSAFEMFGYPLNQIGSKPEILFGMDRQAFVRLMADEAPIKLNQAMYSEDGVRVDVDIQIQRFKVRQSIWYLLNIRDIKARRESERKLNTFEIIFKNAAEAMLVTDNKLNIIWANAEFTKLYGYSEEELIGQTPKLIQSDMQDRSFYRKMWQALANRQRWEGELTNRRKDGSLVTVHQSIVRIDDEATRSVLYISVAKDLTEKKAYEDQLFLLAYTNKITGLFNRDYLRNVFVNEHVAGAVFIKVNDLKFVRSAYGDLIANQYLIELAARIKGVSAFSLFHYYDDTFLLLPKAHSDCEGDCEQLLENLETALNQSISVENTNGYPDVTIVASKAEPVSDLETIIRRAQMTLEYALHMKIKKPLLYDEAIGAFTKRQFGLRQALKRALLQNEYFVVYQPIIELSSGRIMGMEALLRWNSKEFGLVPPLEFINILESQDLIHDVGLFVMETAFRDYQELSRLAPDQPLRLSLNISAIQLTHRGFPSRVSALLDTYQIPETQLIFEIVESQSFDQISLIQEHLRWIRSRGIQLAIDDFGTEYSSLTRLSQMDVQYLKLDKSFFDNVHKSVTDAVLVSGVIAMAFKMNMEVIAEGIEQYEQLLFVCNQKCQYVQGYYFERPLLFEELAQKRHQDYLPAIEMGQVFSEDYRLQLNQTLTQMKHVQNLELGMIETDEMGLILYINQNMANWLGALRQSLIGTSMKQWIAWEGDYQKFASQGSLIDTNEVVISVHSIGGAEVTMSASTRRLMERSGKVAKVVWYFENIEAEAQHRQGLLEKRDSYRKVFMHSPLPIVIWDTDYKIVDWNVEADSLFHLKQAANVFHLDHLFHPEGISALRFHAERLMMGHESVMENTNVDALGISHICQWHSQPVFSEGGSITKIISIIEDITLRVSAEAKVKQLFRVLDQSEQLYVLTDASDRILYVNQRMQEAFNLVDPAEKMLSDLNLVFVNEDNSLCTGFDSAEAQWHGFCMASQAGNLAYKCYREVIQDEATGQSLNIYSLRDESEQREQTKEIEAMKKLFAEQERLATIGHLAAGVAHEINNPLSYMLTNNDFLKANLSEFEAALENTPLLRTDLTEIVGSFDEGLNQIKHIVSDLKGFARANPDKEKVPTQLNDLIPKVINVAHNEIKYTAVVKLDLDPGLPEIEMNPSKIQQVMLNLMLNANHAIVKQQSGAMGEIRISTRVEGEYGVLAIADNGCGMSEETMARIFEPFFTTKPEGVGTGLGLSISKDIVEGYHGGMLEVSSVLGQGTVFRMLLPLLPDRL